MFISQLLLTHYGSKGGPDAAAAVSAVLFGLAFVLVLVTEKLVSRDTERS